MSSNAPLATSVLVEIAPGELVDKITILQIKSERIRDEAKLQNVRTELAVIESARDKAVSGSPELDGLSERLKEVNEQLWDIEDEIRKCEKVADFGDTFIQLARAVYRTNDARADLKRQINHLLGSRLVEEKDYQEYE